MMEISVELTNKCMNNCLFCSSESSKNDNTKLNFSEVISIIDSALDIKTDTISISGGEPLLYPYLLPVLIYAKKNGLKINMYTSGVFNYNFVTDYMFNQCDKVIFDIPSWNSEIYNYLTDSTNYDVFKQNLITSLSSHNNIEAHIVPNKHNYLSLDNMAETLLNLGLKKVSILRMVYQGRAEQNKDELYIDNNIIVGKINKLVQKYGDFVRIGHPFSSSCIDCHAGSKKLNINVKGMVFPCEAFKNNKLSNDYSVHYQTNFHKIQRIVTPKQNNIKDSCVAQYLLNSC